MRSPILLFGLAHKASIVRPVISLDSAGGVSETSETTLYSNIPCRVCPVKDETDKVQQEHHGFDGPEYRRIIFPFLANVKVHDIVTIPWGVAHNLDGVAPGKVARHRILWVNQFIDHYGRNHHTSVIVENETS
jgi:hypothetical protein